jgi:hypothetical protein
MEDKIQNLFSAIFPGGELNDFNDDLSALFAHVFLEKAYASLSVSDRTAAGAFLEKSDWSGLINFLEKLGVRSAEIAREVREEINSGIAQAMDGALSKAKPYNQKP